MGKQGSGAADASEPASASAAADRERASNRLTGCARLLMKQGKAAVYRRYPFTLILKGQPERLARLLAHLKAPLRDAAAVNTTRWAMYERLTALGSPVEGGSGGLTKYNRVRRGTYVGKVAVRSRGIFNITTAQSVVTDIHHRWCRLVARADGHTYQQRKEAAFPPSE